MIKLDITLGQFTKEEFDTERKKIKIKKKTLRVSTK